MNEAELNRRYGYESGHKDASSLLQEIYIWRRGYNSTVWHHRLPPAGQLPGAVGVIVGYVVPRNAQDGQRLLGNVHHVPVAGAEVPAHEDAAHEGDALVGHQPADEVVLQAGRQAGSRE